MVKQAKGAVLSFKNRNLSDDRVEEIETILVEIQEGQTGKVAGLDSGDAQKLAEEIDVGLEHHRFRPSLETQAKSLKCQLKSRKPSA